MTGLRNELNRMNRNLPGGVCQMCEMMGMLSREDVEALNEALDSRSFHATMIAKALENVGQSVSVASIRRHRRGECATGRKM